MFILAELLARGLNTGGVSGRREEENHFSHDVGRFQSRTIRLQSTYVGPHSAADRRWTRCPRVSTLMKTLVFYVLPDTRLGIFPLGANGAKHVKVESRSPSGRRLLPLLKPPSTLRNEGN